MSIAFAAKMTAVPNSGIGLSGEFVVTHSGTTSGYGRKRGDDRPG